MGMQKSPIVLSMQVEDFREFCTLPVFHKIPNLGDSEKVSTVKYKPRQYLKPRQYFVVNDRSKMKSGSEKIITSEGKERSASYQADRSKFSGSRQTQCTFIIKQRRRSASRQVLSRARVK